MTSEGWMAQLFLTVMAWGWCGTSGVLWLKRHHLDACTALAVAALAAYSVYALQQRWPGW